MGKRPVCNVATNAMRKDGSSPSGNAAPEFSPPIFHSTAPSRSVSACGVSFPMVVNHHSAPTTTDIAAASGNIQRGKESFATR